jgi:3-deoxy-7-phosphoheptulonate synthase
MERTAARRTEAVADRPDAVVPALEPAGGTPGEGSAIAAGGGHDVAPDGGSAARVDQAPATTADETAACSWHPSSWRNRPAAQQPSWPDPVALEAAVDELRRLPPLVFAGEARRLVAALAAVAEGRAFLLQAGDCAESFAECSANAIRDKLKVILQMAVVLTYGAGVPVVKVGRIAGQFAKPRSSPTEVVDGVVLEAFRGHMVNDDAPRPEARVPDPSRLLTAYHQAATTLNLLRAFTKGGFADLSQVHAWNLEFVASSQEGQRYEQIASEIDRALRFMAACGIDLATEETLHEVDFYTSHEALILGYEEALTRQDSLTGLWYDCSAHMLWVGERTRQLDGAHVEFLSGIHNPVGCKLGPSATPEEALELCKRLNPGRIPGRLTLITRMGAAEVQRRLPPIVEAVTAAGHPVVWACDPMHGNTFVTDSGRKTRHFEDILQELHGFFAVHRELGTWPGGVHVELTGDNVTECLGGEDDVRVDHLDQRYTTACDPRLNARQAIDLAFRVAELLRS